ncbi:MAG: glycosyl hydrolase 2 galactose-binding domain-containing protein [Chloroflexota bacterium]
MLEKVDLSGAWDLRPVERFDASYRQGFEQAGWLQQELPAHWQQLPELEHHAGKVVYRRRFDFAPSPGRRYRLRLNGVFYWSTVWLNGRKVGDNEGYFMPREYDVTDIIAADNTLIVEVDCPDEKQKSNKRMITGVFSHWDCLDPATNPGGIWLPVELVSSGPAHFERTWLTTVDFDTQSARVKVDIAVAGAPGTYRWQLKLTPDDSAAMSHTADGSITVGEGRGAATAELACPDYRLWWTHDTGPQHLYRAEFTLFGAAGEVSDRVEFDWGMRLFRFDNFVAYLNKRRLFLKGNNYPPGDTRIATMTRERATRDLRLARDCHMNILRVHAHVDHPEFYAAADREGVLIWQDFPLQWQYRRSVLPEALRQVKLMVDLLHNHPSIVVWCMHNEPIYIVDTKDESVWRNLRTITTTFVYSHNREVMDAQMKRAVEALDSSRFVQRSSGELPLFGKNGDVHVYFGWYGTFGQLRSFDRFRLLVPRMLRFITEFGAQSYPNYESATKFMDADIKKIDFRHLTERHHLQPDIMAHWYDWRSFTSLQQLIDVSQNYQSELNRYYIDRLRFHKYRPTGGIVPFMFHDSNPAVQWSIIDYWRVPKSSYWAMRVAFAPIYAFTLLWKDEYRVGEKVDLPVYVVNDTWEMTGFKVRARLSDPAGKVVAEHEYDLRLEGDSPTYTAGRIEAELPAGESVFTLTWQHRGEELVNTYRLVAREQQAKR